MLRKGLSVLGLLALAGIAGFYAHYGTYGLNVLVRRAGTHFVTVTPDDPRLTPAMRSALLPEPPEVVAGPLRWIEQSPGFETAELPIVGAEQELDRLLLARIDASQFRFEVLTAPAGDMELGDWMTSRSPALIINGSYFDRKGRPDTPIKSAGTVGGPVDYKATHGMFAASANGAAIRDLLNKDWRPLMAEARDALVSYPMLLAQDGTVRVKSDRRWLANRSFVAQDRAGRIILGTTTGAFFSLERLALFLKRSPLDLVVALNLDGGPLACQAIRIGSFDRDFCGNWETQTSGEDIILLRRVFGNRRWALPIVIAVSPKQKM